MTFSNFIPKVTIHPILLLFLGIAFLTGMFLQMMVILTIVFIHELGHYFMATFFNWRVKQITLWIFGGVMKTEEHGTRPLMEEALVTVAGPFQHVVIFVLVKILPVEYFLPVSVIDLLLFYNQFIFFFNLIPLWPLDGGKLLLITLSRFFPFQKSYHVTILFSIIFCILLIPLQFYFLSFQLSASLLLLFLLLENLTEWKKRYYMFIRFLLNRYEEKKPHDQLHPLTIPHHASLMEVFTHFYREKNHSIYIEFPQQITYEITEKECLQYYFLEKRYHETIGQMIKKVS